MKRLLAAILLSACLLPLTIEAKKNNDSKKDPVVATVNGKDIKLSEFEYLYNKNRSQQVNPQSLDEYADMFVVYKLKVADAEAAGLDSTASFVKEYNQYVNELALPYITDMDYLDSLRRVLYERMKTDREIAHIQLRNQEGQKALLDSIRQAVLNGADFGEMAAKYSIDKSAKQRKGVLGWIPAGAVPYEIEDQIYNTPVGELSPVFETKYGLHLFNVLRERPARGEILARHILKTTKDKSPEEIEKIRHSMDSIHTLLENGGDFTKIAIQESEDPGSASKGGLLSWFGTGKMVPQFEEAAFSLSKGQISGIVESPYGFHIIKVEDTRGLGPYEEELKKIDDIMARDGRGQLPLKRNLDRLKPKYNTTLIPETRTIVEEIMTAQGTNDSTAMALMVEKASSPAAKVGNRTITIEQILQYYPQRSVGSAAIAMKAYDEILDHVVEETLKAVAIEDLPNENSEFGNLVNEYRDGILLYEISNRNVWERSTTDAEGLETYFQAHKSDFTNWTEPRYKGLIGMATNDSIAVALKEFVNGEGATLEGQELHKAVRKHFGSNARVDYVLAKKGDNAIADFVVFGGEKPKEARPRQ